MAKMTAQIPLGRLGKSSELGAAICFLCSDGAGFVTGHVLPHAGGWA
jgi:3-oxoacyl-[acyl-carrier protein] reductase